MNKGIAAVMAEQSGLVLRRQALATGMSAEEIKRTVRRGEWVAVRRGVYTTRSLWDALEPRERPLLEVRAASLNMVMPHVISHDSAALLHGMPILEATPRLVHITRFGVQGSRTRHGVKHHLAPFESKQIDFVDGLPVLDIARTAVDICREHGRRHGLVACDSAMRLIGDRSLLHEAAAPMRSWRHVTVVRDCVGRADAGAETVGESLFRDLLDELGLGPVETQFGLRADGREVWCDMRIGRQVFEFDGRLKFRTEAEGGVAKRDPGDVLWAEKKRQDFVCGFKLGMSRAVWADLMPGRREATKRRVLREYTDTCARFGTSIEDLEPYVVRRLR